MRDSYERVMYDKQLSYHRKNRRKTVCASFESWEVKRRADNEHLGFIRVFSLPTGAGSDIEFLPLNWIVV